MASSTKNPEKMPASKMLASMRTFCEYEVNYTPSHSAETTILAWSARLRRASSSQL